MTTQVFTLPLSAPLSVNATPTLLPTQAVGARNKEVWAVVPAAALSWHCVTLPTGLKQKNRLLPVLQSLLEEHLLDEPEAMHLAIQPQWQESSQIWVAVCQKEWLRAHLNELQNRGQRIHRIVPEWSPLPTNANPSVQVWVSGVPEDAWLWISTAQGAWRLPLQAGIQLWSEQLSAAQAKDHNFIDTLKGLTIQAEPAVADLAQKSLQVLQSMVSGAASESLNSWRIAVTPAAERYAQAAATDWDLAQFEFAAHGSARWRQSLQRAWQQLAYARAWRPVRWSLAILVVVQFLGINAAAWQLNAKVKAQKELQKNILTQTFPNVPVVDASLQMSRELERLQRQAGSLSGKDLETVLQAIGMALPEGQSINSLDFQSQGAGEIRLQGLQLSNEQQTQFISALRSQGYDAQLNAGQWRIVSNMSNGNNASNRRGA